MEKNNYLFEPPIGKSLSNYELDLIKIMLEDCDFFKAAIGVIDPNKFTAVDAKEMFYILKTFYSNTNCCPDFEIFSMELRRDAMGDEFKTAEFEEYLKEISERTITQERKEQVEKSFLYFNAYKSLIALSVQISDALLKDGLKTENSFWKLLEKTDKTYLEIRKSVQLLKPEEW